MKALMLTILSLMMCSISYSQTIAGVWDSGKENTTIEVLQEGGAWVGKIRSSDNDQAPIGKVILKDLEKQGGIWTGRLFVISKQRWVDVTITPFKSNLELLVSSGFSKRKVNWEKVN